MADSDQRCKAPYSLNVDQDTASQLVKQGASVLLLDLPVGTSVGLDLYMFVTGPNFKGMKMIPPGPHFMYYCATAKHGGDSAPVIGFFFYATPGLTIIRRWDLEEERLVKLVDSCEEERYGHAVRNFEFDQYLGAYDIHHFKQWQQLSSYITADVIDRFEPVGGDITIMAETEVAQKQFRDPSEKLRSENAEDVDSCEEHRTENAEDVAFNKTGTSGRCFYTSLPRLVKRRGATPGELTLINMDKSSILEKVLKEEYNGSERLLLGELQFSFIAFLMGHSLESFAHWKAILVLLFGCEEAPLCTRTTLFVKVLEVIYFQLKQGLKDDDNAQTILGENWLSEDSFLGFLCKEFLATLKNAQPIDGALLHQARKLRQFIENSLGWNLDTNVQSEYAPVIVPSEETEIS